MDSDLYPWNGEFATGDPGAPLAVVTLGINLELPTDRVAIHGKMKTENLGIEKVVANVISNPNIRFVIVFGEEIRGHRAGGSLLALHRHGLDENRRIKNGPGAVPYIENITQEAVSRFREQIEIIDLLNETKMDILLMSMNDCLHRNPGTFGEPFIAIQIKSEISKGGAPGESLALHNNLIVSPFLEISNLENERAGLILHSALRMTTHGRVDTAG